MPHAIVVQCSISLQGSLLSILQIRVKKSEAWALLFWIFPLTRAHTLRAKGHSYSMWLTVSLCWLHTAQRGSNCTFFLHKLSRVGKIFEHALHRKFHTFGGVLRDHIDFHKCPSTEAIKWSPSDGLSTLCATPYADLTEKVWDLFSFHTNTSLAYKLDRGVLLKISTHVWASNQYTNLALSHCFVSSSTNSLTFDGHGPFLWKHGDWGSHWCLTISIEVPLLTFHFDPSSIISRACSILHTYNGLLPNSASKKKQLGK